MTYYLTPVYDIYTNIFTPIEYSVEPDITPYPMTEAEIGEYQYYESMASDLAKDYQTSF